MLPRTNKSVKQKPNIFYQIIKFKVFDTEFSFTIKVSKGED